MVNWSSPDPCAAASMITGRFLRSFARSGVVTTIATPPSLSWQQSSNRTGSAIIREFW
ncbi:Uncharacterised protein [Mycobacteroides abscessus subsp. abscessus]|nr:Uncharacterised protein [Mycobacteroides abscessus subsp. abscessus]